MNLSKLLHGGLITVFTLINNVTSLHIQSSMKPKKIKCAKRITTHLNGSNNDSNPMSSNIFDRRRALSILILTQALPCFAKEEDNKKKTGTVAKDIYGASIIASLASSKTDRTMMVQGLKSEPTYLLIDSTTNEFEGFALNAECTHLGCVVPWSDFENKFVCPCHGSQYDRMGLVLRGPAPHPLVLAHVERDEANQIVLSKWTEEDFRTNEKPWWT